MRRIALFIAIIAAAVATVALCYRAVFWNHHLELKTYFQDVHGLRAGAPVRLAGVEIGRVKSVQAHPEMSQHPAEVVMVLSPPYELKIPNDAAVSVQTEGVLNGEFVDINIVGASGSPATSGAILKSRETSIPTASDLIDTLAKSLKSSKADSNRATVSPR